MHLFYAKFAPIVFLVAFLLLLPNAVQAEQTFSDVNPDHTAYDAIEFLKANNIVTGYEDGTFKPEKAVNRAEALKLIFAPLIKADQLEQAKSAKTVFSDVADDAWFKPYLEIARASGIVDGPPTKLTFNGGSPVIKAEFIKMVLGAYGVDAKTNFGEIRLPLSKDVTNPDEWYYPYLRYGITSSMTMISGDGQMNPGKQLTRSETAILLYRYIMYTQDRRTQALLSEAENEILIVLQLLEKKDIEEAEFASARALLAARGAHMSKPDQPIVQGAVKITESFRALVRGYRAGINLDFEEAIRLSGEAWNLAERAKEKTQDLSQIATQVQGIAKGMADSAREKKAGSSPVTP